MNNKYGFSLSIPLGHSYTKQTYSKPVFVAYLKFKWDEAIHILSSNCLPIGILVKPQLSALWAWYSLLSPPDHSLPFSSPGILTSMNCITLAPLASEF